MRDPRHASIRTNIPEVANYTIIYKPQPKMPISNRLYPIKVETEKERDVSVKKKTEMSIFMLHNHVTFLRQSTG